MSLLKKHKNNLLQRWSFLIGFILSFCGISVGNFGCSAYGPPDDSPREQLYGLKSDVSILEKKIESLNMEKSELIKSSDKRKVELKNLNSEKDSLIILLESNEK